MNPPSIVQKHQKSINLSGNHFATPSMDPVLARSVSAQESATAVLPCRRQSNPGKWTLRMRSWRCTEPAHSVRSLGAQHGRTRHHPSRALAEFPDPSEITPASLAWAGSSRIPAVANAAGRVAPRSGTAAAAEMGIKYNGASASRNIRPSASHQFPRHHVTVPHHVTDHLTCELFHSPISLKTFRPSSSSAVQLGSTPRATALMAGRRRCTSTRMRPGRSATRFRAEVQREEEQQWDWVVPKRERGGVQDAG